MALVMGARVVGAQVVELRIIEREGQGYMPWPPQAASFLMDGKLNFAVQGRVVGSPGRGIQAVTFQVVAPCEQDSWGEISPLLVSKADGAYDFNPNQGVNRAVLQGGIAAQFCGIAAEDSSAEGLVNWNGPGFVNNASTQEIGMVRLSASGKPLLKTLDLDVDGVPDTSELNGTGGPIPVGTRATLSEEIGTTYFGADGNWVDLYRFQYNKTGFGGCPATITFRVEPVGGATVFAEVDRGAADWEALSVPATGVRGGSVTVFMCSGGTPCPADQDGSGMVDVGDVFQYVSDWFNGCGGLGGAGCGPRSADFDCNGVLTVEDMFAFIGRWFAGC